MFIELWRNALQIMLHPASNTKKDMGIADALVFYYKLSIIPGMLAIALIVCLSHLTGNVGVYSVISVLTPWLLTPISILINAGWVHLVGKLAGKLKKSYASTLTAYVYAAIPSLIVIWLSLSTLILAHSSIYYVILLLTLPFSAWGILVLIYSLSNLQRITRLAALGIWLLAIVLMIVLAFVIAFALVYSGIIGAYP